MGLLSKVKNLFLEEEEVETEKKHKKPEPEVKNKEPKKIEKKQDEPEQKVEDIISERDLFKSDSTFKFPVMFEEDEILEEKEKSKHVNVLDFETTKIKNKEEKDIKKIFRPTPIVSPVYGILDKNYKKQDIVDEKDRIENIEMTDTDKVSIDDIRNKAYGTLEEELEQTLSDNDSMFYNLKEEKKESTEEEPVEELMSSMTDELIMGDVTLEQAEENYDDLKVAYNVEKVKHNDEELHKDKVDKEHLFDLIDSMYEVEEGSE